MEHAGRQVSDPEMARALRDAGGLGTAATRAEIIENLKSKDYVYANLQPTTKGLHLIRFLKLARAEHLTSPQLTAELEKHLSMVESSSRTRDSFIQETARSVQESLKAMTSFDLEKSFDHAPSVGYCPRCKGTVHERMWNYSCQSNRQTEGDCGFTVPKDCDGRWLDPPSLSRLLVAGESGMILDGFPSAEKASRSNKRTLKIKNGTLEISDEFGKPLDGNLHTSENKSSTKRRVTWGACPVHKADACLIVETKNAFICETKLKCLKEGQMESVGFQLPKSICEQRLKFEDINSFIHTGRTRVIEGFKSRGGKVFDATLVRNPAGSWTFEFRNSN
jgi:DNA topoisomerase-3